MHKYHVLRKLGMGTIGITYLIKQKQNNVKYALKAVECKDSTHVNCVYNECIKIAKIQHPYIGKIKEVFIHYDVERISFYLMIVTDYYEYNFQDYLDNLWLQKIEINYDFTTQTLVQFLEILSILKSFNLSHLNIKPTNVCIIDNYSHIKLIDFGLEAVLNDQKRLIRIKPDIYWCSSIFNHQINPTKSDIWSVGIIMYSIMLTKVMNKNDFYKFINSIDKYNTNQLFKLVNVYFDYKTIDFVIGMLDSNIETGIDLFNLNTNKFYQQIFHQFSSTNVKLRQRQMIKTDSRPVPFKRGVTAVIDYINSEKYNENCIKDALIWFHGLTRSNIADKLPTNYTTILSDALKINNTNLTIANCSIYSLTYLAMFCNSSSHELFNESTQKLIIETVKLHRDDISLNKTTTAYFIVSSSFPESSKIAGKIGAIQYLIDNLRIFQNPIILSPTLNALWNLCVEPVNCEIAIQQKSRDIILKICDFSFESVEVILHATACLLAVITSLDVSLNVDYVTLTNLLISSLKEYSRNINLIKYICILLENLIEMNEEYGMQVLECTNNRNNEILYGLEVLELVYQIHNDNSTIAHLLCRIIVRILSYPDLVDSILIETQVLNIVDPIKRRFQKSEDIFKCTEYIFMKIDHLLTEV